MDGGQRAIQGYWHLEMDEQVEVGRKEWVKLSGEERKFISLEYMEGSEEWTRGQMWKGGWSKRFWIGRRPKLEMGEEIQASSRLHM